MRHKRHFINEQPKGSTLYEETPWPEVLNMPGVTYVDFDQCRTGLKARNGLLVKKATRLYASHIALLYHFLDLLCDGSHEHQQLHGNHTSAAQVWTLDFCSRVVSGIARLRKLLDRLRFYPSIAAGPDAGEGLSESPPPTRQEVQRRSRDD